MSVPRRARASGEGNHPLLDQGVGEPGALTVGHEHMGAVHGPVDQAVAMVRSIRWSEPLG